jgi:hypothetical protein
MPRYADSPETIRPKDLLPAGIRERVQSLMSDHSDYLEARRARDVDANASAEGRLIWESLLRKYIVDERDIAARGLVHGSCRPDDRSRRVLLMAVGSVAFQT